MATTKRIVCLANSYKDHERCLAGKEYRAGGGGEWVRPVSSRAGQGVNSVERRYEHGAEPELLDVIDIPLLEARPSTFQSENWLLDPSRRWIMRGQVDWAGLVPMCDAPESLWTNRHSTNRGSFDVVPVEVADTLDSSLYLIHVERVDVTAATPGIDFGDKRCKVRGRFQYRNVWYGLSITDPVMVDRYCGMGLGQYAIEECCLTISLGKPFPEDNRCYKLIAAVMERPT